MDMLARQVRQARRRLFWQRWLAASVGACSIGMVVAIGMIVIDKFQPLGLLWWAWPLMAASVAIVGAGGLAWWQTRDPLRAAWEIDQRFGLRERVSSSLALTAEERATPVGQALVNDAAERIRRLAIGEQFRVRPSRWALLPLATCGLAAVIALLWQPAASESRTQAERKTSAQQQAVKQSSEALRKKLVEQKQEAEKLGLKNAEELFNKLERGTQELAKTPDGDRKQALASLNDLAKELDKRRQGVTGAEALKEQFQRLKPFEKGPADRMAEALRKGDAEQAMKEVQKLRDALQKGGLDEQAKADLAKQLADMEQKIRDAAQAQQQAIDQVKERIAQERAAGNAAQAEQLEQQLAQMQQQQARQQQLDKLAQKLGKAAEALQKDDAAGAQQQLDQLAQDLDALQQQAKEDEMLADALEQMQQAKDQMNCKQCQGGGCEACRGGNGAQGAGKNGRGQGGQGDGLGAGRGKGFRPENPNETGAFDTRVRQKVGRSAAKVTDFVEGPNAKGQVQQEIKTQWNAVEGAATDPLSDQPLPRDYREHTKKYFDALREGR